MKLIHLFNASIPINGSFLHNFTEVFIYFIMCAVNSHSYPNKTKWECLLSFFYAQLWLPCFFSHRLALSNFPRMNTNSSDEFFQATNHAEQTFRKMETYLQHKQLCDVLLIAGDHKIPAHRLASVCFGDINHSCTDKSNRFSCCAGFTSLSCLCVHSGFSLDLRSAHQSHPKDASPVTSFL